MSPNRKMVAVVLSGCGHRDGSEITEAVSALIALSETGADVACFAPNRDFSTINHVTGVQTDQRRNCLIEAARIARVQIKSLQELNEVEFDAVVFPGGLGAATQFSNWNSVGAKAKVDAEVERVLRSFHQVNKPIGAICIAPTLVALVLGREGITLTVGDDAPTIAEIVKTGAHHVRCAVTDYVSDRDHKVLSTPAYMCAAKPHEIFLGIQRMVRELVEMA